MVLDFIVLEGYVVEYEDQEFMILYDYNEKKMKNFGMSFVIKEVIIVKGYDFFEKQNFNDFFWR